MRLALAFVLLLGPPQEGVVVPDVSGIADVLLEPAFGRFEKPVSLAFLPGGRVLVAEQTGKVWHIDGPARRPVLDWSARLGREDWEEGLLSLAVHPRFPARPFLFVRYTGVGRRNVLARVSLAGDPPTAVPGSERILLDLPNPEPRHFGGALRFGPDGFLYVGFGDGGRPAEEAVHAQRLDSLLGKILRIDVDGGDPYAIPSDNPFAGRPGARPEIWARGFRNPWSFHFDRRTGALWAGDVGDVSSEEINLVRRGGNYGWNIREGLADLRGCPDEPFDDPVLVHGRDEARSITGGIVYRGPRRPELQGVYLYGDFVTGELWGLRLDGGKVTARRSLARCNQLAAFAEDHDGELYVTSFDGTVYAIR
ncbi:MAG TPA: PQQ-dependent sugar dehydrogenase [Planctomycetota bacterium]|nr:PQQ-dependent sugar dehydrogenase [Planctomycetota bacterium]